MLLLIVMCMSIIGTRELRVRQFDAKMLARRPCFQTRLLSDLCSPSKKYVISPNVVSFLDIPCISIEYYFS